MGYSYVYVWQNLNDGKQYVGVGSGFRALMHAASAGSGLLSVAMANEGIGVFRLRLEAVRLTKAEAHQRERELIAHLKSTHPAGYNRPTGLYGNGRGSAPQDN
jgi:hypothetical protein